LKSLAPKGFLLKVFFVDSEDFEDFESSDYSSSSSSSISPAESSYSSEQLLIIIGNIIL
jgi:hypothetical protein